MKTISFSSIKGGTGKTSLAILTGNLLAKAGYKILMVDLDIQNSLTFYYLDFLSEDQNAARALQEDALPDNILPTTTDRIHILPSSLNLLKLRSLNTKTLQRLLPQVNGEFDYCVIDSAPTLDNISLNGLQAADLIITPARLDMFDFKSLQFLGEQLELETDRSDAWKIIINFYRQPRSDSQGNLFNQFSDVYQQNFPNLLDIKIPESVLIQKAVNVREIISPAKVKQKVFSALVELAEHITGQPLKVEGGF